MRWNLAWLLVLTTVALASAVDAAPQSRFAGKAIPSATEAETSESAPGSADVGNVKETSEGFAGVARTGAALAFVVTLVLLLAWGYRKATGDRSVRGPNAATVLARNPISPRAGVVLIKVGRRVLVCGESSGHPLSTLSEITDADEVAELEGRLSGNRPEPKQPFVMAMADADAEYSADDVETSDYPDPADSEVAAALGNDLAANTEVDQTKGELAGLMERVRTITRHLRTNQRSAT